MYSEDNRSLLQIPHQRAAIRITMFPEAEVIHFGGLVAAGAPQFFQA